MTDPSPLIMETLAAHRPVYIAADSPREPVWVECLCASEYWRGTAATDVEHETHVAQALVDAGVLDPEQVRERSPAARGWNDAARLVQEAHDDWHLSYGIDSNCENADPLCNLAKRLTPQEDT